MAGKVLNDPYSQSVYQNIIGPTQNDPARQAYLLQQAGLSGGIVGPNGLPPTPSTPQVPGSGGAGYKPGQVFNPSTGTFSAAPGPTGIPTFAPPDTAQNPSSAITSQPDPKIQALITQLSAQSAMGAGTNTTQIDDLKRQIQEAQTAQGATTAKLDELSQPFNIAKPDTSKTDAQSAQLQALLSQLMKGEGINVAPVSNDPQAQAFRVAKLRAAEEARASEAARLGASGVTGSGDFDARLAQINEAAGSDIAGFEANLTGQRRQEATQTALSGAQLGLADVNAQRTADQTAYENQVNTEQARRSGVLSAAQASSSTSASKISSLEALLQTLMGSDVNRTQNNEQLLQTLLGEQGRVQDTATSNSLAAQQAAIQAEQFRQANEDRLRAIAKSGGSMVGGVAKR